MIDKISSFEAYCEKSKSKITIERVQFKDKALEWVVYNCENRDCCSNCNASINHGNEKLWKKDSE